MPGRTSAGFVLTSLAMLIIVGDCVGQEHFTDCVSGTGANATLLVADEPQGPLAGLPLGSEMAAFTSDNVCAGAGTWTGGSLAITVWGDDPLDEGKAGLREGEPIDVRLWDLEAEYSVVSGQLDLRVTDLLASRVYEGAPPWRQDAIFLVDGLVLKSDTSAVHREDGPDLPEEFRLLPNFPNPFNRRTAISYALPRTADVTLTVFDVLRRQIRHIAAGTKPAGTHEVLFDAAGLPASIYFYRLQAGDYVETKRMIVVR